MLKHIFCVRTKGAGQFAQLIMHLKAGCTIWYELKVDETEAANAEW